MSGVRHDRMGDLLLAFQRAAYRGRGLTTQQMKEYGGPDWGDVYVRLQARGFGFRASASKFKGGRPWKYTLVTEPQPADPPAPEPAPDPADDQAVLFDVPEPASAEPVPMSAVFGDPDSTGRR